MIQAFTQNPNITIQETFWHSVITYLGEITTTQGLEHQQWIKEDEGKQCASMSPDTYCDEIE